MNKKCKILFFCMIFATGVCFSQKTTAPKLTFIAQALQPAPNRPFNFNKLSNAKTNTNLFLSADYYAKQLGFFCKQEIKFDKLTKVPFRFRLGSVEQCNWLEGKSRKF